MSVMLRMRNLALEDREEELMIKTLVFGYKTQPKQKPQIHTLFLWSDINIMGLECQKEVWGQSHRKALSSNSKRPLSQAL